MMYISCAALSSFIAHVWLLQAYKYPFIYCCMFIVPWNPLGPLHTLFGNLQAARLSMDIRSITMNRAFLTLAQQSHVVPMLPFRSPESVNYDTGGSLSLILPRGVKRRLDWMMKIMMVWMSSKLELYQLYSTRNIWALDTKSQQFYSSACSEYGHGTQLTMYLPRKSELGT